MSLESLFQHIIFTEHQAEESRRLMREGGPALGGHLAFGAGCLPWGVGWHLAFGAGCLHHSLEGKGRL